LKLSGTDISRANPWPSIPIDLSWQNIVFSVRTFLAALAALAICYWLNLREPQWAIYTVYIVAQPTAGAAVAKGLYRVLGTMVGAAAGLIALALFAEDPVPFVATMVLWLGFCIYAATISRNFVTHGLLLAGYTALLVGYQGAAHPDLAWRIAGDRTTEIGLGIACAAIVSMLIMPRYAGDALRASLATTFSALAKYGATAMRPDTPAVIFMAQRRQMIAQIVTVDALRSYAAFESLRRRASDQAIQRVMREFLTILAAARGLYVRLEDFRTAQSAIVLARLDAVLPQTAASLERIAAETTTRPNRAVVLAELDAAADRLTEAAAQLEALAGTMALDPLANGLLIINRARAVLHGLTEIVIGEAATTTPMVGTQISRAPAADRIEAVIQALRGALALLLVSVFWAATTWSAGLSAVVGLAIMLFILINQNDPGSIGWPFMAAVAAALIAAYAAMVLVLPWLQDFLELAIFLAIIMVPAGLLIGTPRFTLVGIGFGSIFIIQIATGNRFQPDAQAYVNASVGMLLGMATGMAVIAGVMPIDPLAIRQRAWRAVLRALPAAARGEDRGHPVASDILSILITLLPRLDLDRAAEETTLRGVLGSASMSVELARLHRCGNDPALPQAARDAITMCMQTLAGSFAKLVGGLPARGAVVAEAEASVAAARAALACVSVEPGSEAAREVLRAASSLRFVADRFNLDRPFLLGSFGDA
jgi:uncharacterized membrane protein YccC